jgi:hypothetical protein
VRVFWALAYLTAVDNEIYITALRAITTPIYWTLFEDVVRRRCSRPSTSKHPLFAISVLIILLPPILVDKWGLPDAKTKLVFAVTSIVVGARDSQGRSV